MRVLFLSYFFPGPLGAMASWLADQADMQVIFASSRSRQEIALRNVQRVVLRTYNSKAKDDPGWVELWEDAIRAAKSAKSTLEMVLKSGFDPDIICCASSNGTAFGLRQVFQDSFIVNFLEDSANFRAGQTKMRQSLQSLQILESNMAFAFNENTRLAYAPELRPLIKLAPPVIDCSFFSPEAAQPFRTWKLRDISDELITVFAYGLSERELFHLWHAVLLILEERPGCQAVFIVQGRYELKRLQALKIDRAIAGRLFLEAHLRQDILRDMLCASSLCLFTGRRSFFGLLESMSCATMPMCVHGRYFLKNGWDMLELAGSQADELAEGVISALKEPEFLREIGQRARQTAIFNFGAATVLPRFFPEIEKACQAWNS